MPIMTKVELVLFVLHIMLACFILSYLVAQPIRKVYLSMMANALLLLILMGQFIHLSSETETFFTADSDCMLS